MATVTKPETGEAEQRFVLYSVDWSRYGLVVEALQDHAGLRITYLDGRLTLVSPSRRHDWYEDTLGNIVKVVATVLGIEWEPAGHATFRQEEKKGGVEGDDTFYFRENAVTMRGPVDIDLGSQPPPDLAIEVEATHPADDSIAVWGRLGVPEIWRFDIKNGALTILVRSPDGGYETSSRSRQLEPLDRTDVMDQVKRAEELGSSHCYSELHDWVRDTLLPRRGA